MFLDAACLIGAGNKPFWRQATGRCRRVRYLKFLFEDLPSGENRVAGSTREPSPPAAMF